MVALSPIIKVRGGFVTPSLSNVLQMVRFGLPKLVILRYEQASMARATGDFPTAHDHPRMWPKISNLDHVDNWSHLKYVNNENCDRNSRVRHQHLDLNSMILS